MCLNSTKKEKERMRDKRKMPLEVRFKSSLNFSVLFSIECFLGIQYIHNIPFMYLNTVGFHTGSISRAGSPQPYSITPSFSLALTDDMNFMQRVKNAAVQVVLDTIHSVSFTFHFCNICISITVQLRFHTCSIVQNFCFN
jgi:hypothetical protein